MRLIDADKITTETFKAYVGENGGFISFGDAVDAIDAIPTAYDVGKVCEEIKESAINLEEISHECVFDCCINCTLDCEHDVAIQIVKRGGVE